MSTLFLLYLPLLLSLSLSFSISLSLSLSLSLSRSLSPYLSRAKIPLGRIFNLLNVANKGRRRRRRRGRSLLTFDGVKSGNGNNSIGVSTITNVLLNFITPILLAD